MAHRDNVVLTNLVRDVIDAISAKDVEYFQRTRKMELNVIALLKYAK